MPNTCAVPQCRRRQPNPTQKMSLHKLPKDEGLKAEWMNFAQMAGVSKSITQPYFCSRHFEQRYFENYGHWKESENIPSSKVCKLILNKNAIPSLLGMESLEDAAHLQDLNLSMLPYRSMEIQPHDTDTGQPRSSPQPYVSNGAHSGVPLTVMEMTDFTVLLPVPRDNDSHAVDEIPQSHPARADSPKLALSPPQRDGLIKDLGGEDAQNKQSQTVEPAPIVSRGDSKNAHAFLRTGLKRSADHLDEVHSEIWEKQHKTYYSYHQYFPRKPLAKGDSDGIANALHQAQRAVYFINGLMEFITSQELGKVNRLEFWSRLTSYVAITMEEVLAFAKRVPGFTSLSQDDQIMVIKGAGFSLVVMHLLWCCIASGYNPPNHEELVLDSLHNLHEEEKDLVAVVLDLLRLMLALKLTEREIAVLNAVVMFQPERCRVQDSTQLKELYGKHLEVFTELGNRSHESPDFAENVFSNMPYIQAISHKHIKALLTFKKFASTAFEFPALYAEIFEVT